MSAAAADRTLPAMPPVMSQAQLNDPATVRRLREDGPVHHISVGGWHDSWIVTGYDAITAVLADSRLQGDADPDADAAGRAGAGAGAGSGTAPGGAEVVLSEEELVNLPGPQHARLRRLIGRQLTPRRVQALTPRIQREIDRLLAAVEPAEAVDLVAALALPLPAIVLCELFGVPEDGRRLVFDYVPGLASEDGPAAEPRAQPGERRLTGMATMAEYLRSLVRQRRIAPGDDLISAMIRTPGDSPTDAELLSAVRLVLVSGHRAVTALVANGLQVLLRRRELWERLVAEPALIDPAVEELLRYVTPIALSVPRYAGCPMRVGGSTIGAGEMIQAAWGSANRDPARFPDPDLFDPCRADNGHLSFGQGHHYCPGAALGRLEATMVLRTLAARFPGVRLATGRPPAYSSGSVRELVTLPLILRPGARP